MAIYCVGDIQGCDAAFGRLLEQIDFSPSRDTVYLLGDLVNRGPDSAAVIRRCMRMGTGVRVLLGNHDLHLLATAHGVRNPSRRDTLGNILDADDCALLLGWLKEQPLAHSLTLGGESLLMVHAGVLPQWTEGQTLSLAREVQTVLSGDGLSAFLQHMYGNEPARWHDDLRGMDRLRTVVNALTRLRFCTPEGAMDFDSSESADQAPDGLVPWFDAPGRRTSSTLIAFGHWSTLGWLNRPHLLGLDTGCVWGGCLSAVRFGSTLAEREHLTVHCDQAQAPG
ncbi:MAG: symmetrical bis(5'-nucleosyl)-tetraphosphatase [Comamonadaceae bacterium]|nr:MAG: symmetrical bis(5'-nucleosyl)-tetraphosphatase [Comamonadaceae bacterium]